MAEHPIQGLMKTAMENIKEMVDVNTIVGDPVETPDGSVIMPISKVGFGFAAGGSEFNTEADDTAVVSTTHRTEAHNGHNAHVALPFGGGSGGGVSITPIAFLVVGKQGVKVVPLDNQTHIFERLIDSAPKVVDKIQSMMKSSTSATQQPGGMMSGLTNAMSGMMGGSQGGMSGMGSPSGSSGMTGSTTGSTSGMSGLSSSTGTSGLSGMTSSTSPSSTSSTSSKGSSSGSTTIITDDTNIIL